MSLADLLAARGAVKQSELLYTRAIAIYEKVFGDDHADTALARNNYANLLKGLGHHESALSLYAASYSACQKILGEQHPRTIMAQYSLKNAQYIATGRDFDGLEYEKLLSHLADRCGSEHPNTETVRHKRDFTLQNRCFVRSPLV